MPRWLSYFVWLCGVSMLLWFTWMSIWDIPPTQYTLLAATTLGFLILALNEMD